MYSEFDGQEKSYCLQLADGTNWSLSATAALEPWLDQFASIMQLQAESGGNAVTRKILFLAMKPELRSPTDSSQWESLHQGAVYRIWSHSTLPESFVELNPDFIDHPEIKFINMWSSLKVLYKYYVASKGGPIHGALIEFQKRGVIIAAAGGTGKSTCCARLPEPWLPLADDNALIVHSPAKQSFYVHPMPTWSDHLWSRRFSSCDSSYALPLQAIFFLEQATCDRVTRLPSALASHKLFNSARQIWENYLTKLSRADRAALGRQIFEATGKIAAQVPCYSLEATLNGSFWTAMEEVL